MKLHDTTRQRKLKKEKQQPAWPFPPPGGPIPWTKKQIKEYERKKLDETEDAPI